jgi:hypothetical protein
MHKSIRMTFACLLSTALVPVGFAGPPQQNKTQEPPKAQAPAQSGGASTGGVFAPVLDEKHRPITAGGFVDGAPIIFEDVTKKAGLDKFNHVSGSPEKNVILEAPGSGVAIVDYDNDGWPDIYLVNGSTFDALRGKQKPPRAALYHNNHDGTFTDVTEKAGVSNDRWGFGVAVGDYDNDGWPDLYVTNYGKNRLYHNNHDGTFTDVGLLSGTALSGDGQAEGSMGVDFADYDHDGLLDIFVTNFAEQGSALYHNLGYGQFDDVRQKAQVAKDSYPLVGWGASFFDMDNDGWPDLLTANGHVYPQMDTVKNSASYAQRMLLYRNNRNGAFSEVSGMAGLAALPLKSRRGAAFGDIANNGNIDIVVLNVGEAPSLLLNTANNSNHRVLFKLIGTKSNRAAIGARVTIHAAGMTQFNEVRGGGSYLSQNDLRLHFGLGPATRIDAVEVRWPSGKMEEIKNLDADKLYTLVEGQGVKTSDALTI